MTDEKLDVYIKGCIGCVVLLVWLTVVLGLAYAGIHFIRKLW